MAKKTTKKTAKKKAAKKTHRSSKTGRKVTKEFAKANPDTTEAEDNSKAIARTAALKDIAENGIFKGGPWCVQRATEALGG